MMRHLMYASYLHRAHGASVVLLATVLVGGAFSGCRDSRDDATVLLTVRDEVIDAGQSTVLLWEARGGTLVILRGANDEELFSSQIPVEGASGQLPIAPLVGTNYRLELMTEDGAVYVEAAVKVAAGGEVPEVHEFSADPPSVLDGESTTLSWVVAGADTVIITDGVLPILVIDEGQALERGSLIVRPNHSTGYLMHSVNGAGSVTTRAFVLLEGRTSITSFTASRDIVSDGEEVVLGWRVVGGTHMTLSQAGGDVLLDTADHDLISHGVWYALPVDTASYVLSIEGPAGSDTAMLDVRAVPAPEIVLFEASSAVVLVGDPVDLRWETTGASLVQVYGADGVLHRSDVANGMTTLTPSETMDFVLLAENAAGYAISAVLVVEVDPPGVHLSASTGLLGADGSAVTIQWSTDGALSYSIWPTLPNLEVVAPAFIDIRGSGTPLALSDTSLDVEVAIGFDFPWGDSVRPTMEVSYFGSVMLDPGTRQTYSGCGVGVAGGITAMQVSDGRASNMYRSTYGGTVHVLQGGAMPARWVKVQWTGMRSSNIGSDKGTDTFQLVMFESGDVAIYTQALATSQVRTIATAASPRFRNSISCVIYSDVPRGLMIRRDTTLPPSGTRRVWVAGTSGYWLTAETATGTSQAFIGFVWARNSGLRVNEIMYDPPLGASATAGEWIEIRNDGSEDVNIGGLSLTDAAGTTLHTLGSNIIIPGEGYFVFGASADRMQNGDVLIDSEYVRSGGLELDDTADCVRLVFRGIEASELCYDELDGFVEASGASLTRQVDATGDANDSRPGEWCAAGIATGAAGLLASPGAENERCVQGDDCRAPITVDFSAGAAHVEGDTSGAVNDSVPDTCLAAPTGNDLIFAFTLDEARLVLATIDTSGSGQPWQPALYFREPGCPEDNSTAISCDISFDSMLTARKVLPAGDFSLVVDSTSGHGPFTLDWQLLPPPALTQSTEAGFVIDITQTGTDADLGRDEAFVNDVALGFELPLLGDAVSSVAISSNGFVAMRPLEQAHYVDEALPKRGAPSGVVAPLWDDLVPGAGGASVHYEQVGVAPFRRLIVQWTGFDFYDAQGEQERSGGDVTFQVILFESGNIEFRYGALSAGRDDGRVAGNSASVGVETGDGVLGYSFSWHEASLAPETVIRWSPQ